jgi:hypothetical protein
MPAALIAPNSPISMKIPDIGDNLSAKIEMIKDFTHEFFCNHFFSIERRLHDDDETGNIRR